MQEQALLMNNVQPAPENRMVKKAGTDSHARFRLPSESSVTAPISVSRYSWADRSWMRIGILICAPGGVDQIGVERLRTGIVQLHLWHTRSECTT